MNHKRRIHFSIKSKKCICIKDDKKEPQLVPCKIYNVDIIRHQNCETEYSVYDDNDINYGDMRKQHFNELFVELKEQK